jgi:hypothetical protein
MAKKKVKSKKANKTITINQIVFEIFEIEVDESFQNKLERDLIIEIGDAFLKKNPTIKRVSLKDQYSITTPEGEGKVLAESIRVLLYENTERNLAEMMNSLHGFLGETRLEDSSYYNFLIPEVYFERFFELDPDGDEETFEEALQKAKEYADFSGLREKSHNEDNFNDYEIEEFGWLAQAYFEKAGIYNYVLATWDNTNLEEFFAGYYFIGG